MADTRNCSGGSASDYKWTDEDTRQLISWRAANGALFTGRRNAAQRGFEEFVKDHSLAGRVDPAKVRKKWENLKQKYKELKAPRTGVSTEGGETTAASWKWYGPMDEAMGQRPSIRPPVIIDSSAQDVVVVSPPSGLPGPEPETPIKRRRRESDWVQLVKNMQDGAEKESEALEREERKERGIGERGEEGEGGIRERGEEGEGGIGERVEERERA